MTLANVKTGSVLDSGLLTNIWNGQTVIDISKVNNYGFQ